MFQQTGGRGDSSLCSGSFWLVEVFPEGEGCPRSGVCEEEWCKMAVKARVGAFGFGSVTA